MAKKFKAKRGRKKILKYLVILLVLYLCYSFISLVVLNLKIVDTNEEFIKNLLADSNYHLLYEKRGKNIIYKLSEMIGNISVNNPTSILEKSFGYKFSNNETLVYNENYNASTSEIKEVVDYMHEKESEKDPVVYIYNTHQTEKYSNEDMGDITPNVLMASYLLKDKLDKLNIPTLVEESNISEFMRINNWKYNQSYKASRFYLLDAKNKYSSIKLFIDLHRDSIEKKNSTVTINKKDYAKVLFVVGKEHANYEKNLDLVNKINNKIKDKYPTLTRGVMEKEGKNVNGIYNQDVSENCLLLELGGNENNITEVLNTVDLMSEIIKEYIDETR
jgi:stage II sporulation protein P